MENQLNDNTPAKDTTVIDFGKILRNYLRHWYWFLISLIVCGALAFIYCKKKSEVYLIKGLVMLNQEESGGVAKGGAMTAMMALVGDGGSDYSNPENEMMKMLSQTNLTEVANKLGLQYNYWTVNGILRKKDWLYPNSPIQVNIPQSIIDTISVMTKFHIEHEPGAKEYSLTVHQDGDKLYETNFTRFPYSAKTPYGTFTLTLTKHFNPNAELNLYATASPTPATVEAMRETVAINYLSKKADALEVNMEEVNTARGCDVVNAIISNYNEHREADKLAHNKASLDFIDNRLLSLYNELESQDTKVEQFKRENRIVDAEAEANYIFTRMESIDEQYTQLQTRMETYRLFRDMLSNPATRDNQIPFTASDLATSEAFGQFMTNYNNLIVGRMSMEKSAKPSTRQYQNLTEQIEETRNTILRSLDREISNTGVMLGTLQNEIKERDARMAGMPAMEHRLLTFERDREVKNQIYAFLLQKREETQIALSQNDPVGKVIDAAYPEYKPIAPKKKLIFAAAFIFGLAIPAVWLQMRVNSPAKKEEDDDDNANP